MRKASRTVTARIHKLNGQLTAIEHMISQKRACADILNQVSAVRAGLEQVAALIFQRELERMWKSRKLTPQDLERLTEIFSKTT